MLSVMGYGYYLLRVILSLYTSSRQVCLITPYSPYTVATTARFTIYFEYVAYVVRTHVCFVILVVNSERLVLGART